MTTVPESVHEAVLDALLEAEERGFKDAVDRFSRSLCAGLSFGSIYAVTDKVKQEIRGYVEEIEAMRDRIAELEWDLAEARDDAAWDGKGREGSVRMSDANGPKHTRGEPVGWVLRWRMSCGEWDMGGVYAYEYLAREDAATIVSSEVQVLPVYGPPEPAEKPLDLKRLTCAVGKDV